jgi:predicted kinase
MNPTTLPCPVPPDWRVEWDALDARYEWVRALRDCPQDPRHHAEGNVWIHTRMVCEAMAALPAWRALDEQTRSLAYAGALLHDVAKPECTRTDADGAITARGHSIRGAIAARQLLWRAGAPFAVREQIAALIRYHQVPFFLIERDDALRLALTVSQTARCDLLALVTEADARGRHCEDGQRLLDNIELFRAYCEEQGCFQGPYPFPSDHGRFQYFSREGRHPDYAPHEDFRCEVVVMSGMPGAGKDTWIRTHLPDWPVVSLDRLRRELDVDPTEPQGTIVAAAREEARGHLRAGRSFVWNATNISRQLRAQGIALFADYGARVRIVYLEASEPRLRRQNRERAAKVPDAVLDRLLDRWEVPDLTEAHQVDYVVHAGE